MPVAVWKISLLVVLLYLTHTDSRTLNLVPRYVYDKIEHSPVYHQVVSVHEQDGHGNKLRMVRQTAVRSYRRKAEGRMRLTSKVGIKQVTDDRQTAVRSYQRKAQGRMRPRSKVGIKQATDC